MSQTLFADQNQIMVGLGTFTYTLPATGMYTVRLQSSEIPPSGIVFKVKDNGSDIFTAPVLGESQGEIQFSFSKVMTSGHIITIVSTSASANDALINSVKTSCSIGAGL